MFTEGRLLDWEKEKLFVFRSVYSNVEIHSVNYKYTIKVEDPVFGNHNYENQVKSLDDKEQEVYETNQCLVLPLQMFREYIGNDFKLVVEIEDLKPREEDDRQSVESIVGKEKEEK